MHVFTYKHHSHCRSICWFKVFLQKQNFFFWFLLLFLPRYVYCITNVYHVNVLFNREWQRRKHSESESLCVCLFCCCCYFFLSLFTCVFTNDFVAFWKWVWVWVCVSVLMLVSLYVWCCYYYCWCYHKFLVGGFCKCFLFSLYISPSLFVSFTFCLIFSLPLTHFSVDVSKVCLNVLAGC